MNAKHPLTARHRLVLAYIEEHPGCDSRAIWNAVGFAPYNAIETLYNRRFIGRAQDAFEPGMRWRYFPELASRVTATPPRAATLSEGPGLRP